jgi:hypothetical protein
MDFLLDFFDNIFSCGAKQSPILVDENDKDLIDYFTLIEESLKTCSKNSPIKNMYNFQISKNKMNFNNMNFDTYSNDSLINKKDGMYQINNQNWKEFIITKIDEEYQRGNDWNYFYFNDLINNNYLSDSEWLNNFFWSNFEQKTKPKCLNNKLNENLNENNEKNNLNENLNKNNEKNEKNNLNKNNENIIENKEINDKKNFYPQSDFFTYETVKENSGLDEITLQYVKYKDRVYDLINLIKEQILNSLHPINIIIRCFVKNFTKYLKEEIEILKSMKKNNNIEEFKFNCKNKYDNIIDQIKINIFNIVQTLTLIYSKIPNYQVIIDESDEFSNLITGIIFDYKNILKKYKKNNENFENKNNEIINNFFNFYENDENFNEDDYDIYKYVYNLMSIRHEEEILLFKSALLKLKEKQPEEFNIKPQFCLNEKSIEYFEKKFQYIEEQININSYENTIKFLSTIKNYNKPLDKLILTNKISKCMSQEITKFWNNFDQKNEIRDLGIESDDLECILKFIVIKCNLPELIIDLEMISKFTSMKTNSSTMLGYYYSMIDVVVMQIMGQEKEIEFTGNEEIK